MESIRNYDPNSFLNFITNIDKQKVCFCHHPTTDLEITKKMILADRNATVIILKPNNKEENKFKIKKHLEFLKSNKKNLYIDNYLKKEVGSKFWSKARKKSKVKCKIVKLTGMSGEFLEIFK